MSVRAFAILAVVLAAGVGAGFLAGYTTGQAESDPKVRAPDERDRQIAELLAELEEVRGAAPPAPAPEAGDPGEPPAPPDLDPKALADRTEIIRRAALRQAEYAEVTARAILKREAAEERRRKEAERALIEEAERGGTMVLLKKLDKNWLAPWDTLQSAESFGGLFARTGDSATLDGELLTAKESPPNGTTIHFPAGRHKLRYSTLKAWKPFPRDLLIQGHGMDRTLLVLDSDLESNGQVENLHFADLTLHANDNYIVRFDEPFALHFERCRIVGFDMGAGGSSMINGDPCAFYAIDCRIEAGYGRSPGFGNLFDVRGVLVSRMERCVIRGPFRSVPRGRSGSAEVYVGCSFEDMIPSLRNKFEKPGRNVKLIDCNVTYLEPGSRAEFPKRKWLREINPDWETEQEKKERERVEERERRRQERGR